jgi:hypothetical protein
MTRSDDNSLSGILLDWPRGPLERSDLTRGGRLRFVRTIQATRWEEYEYRSAQPLRGEDQPLDGGSFIYALICRRSGSRLLLLAAARHISEAVLEREFADIFRPPLHKVPIAVDQLVKSIVDRPTSYVLSYVYARIPAFGASLRSAAFYGEDLGDAALFRENASLMNFATCGVRPAVGGHEILKLSNDGAISFTLTDHRRLLEVEKVLGFLRANGYLQIDLLDSD